jgi:hypothetical protein
MLISAEISKDCKLLKLKFDADDTYEVTITNHITGTEYTDDLNTDVNGNFTVDSEDFGELFNGVFEIVDVDNTVTKLEVGHCEIDCCIAGFLHKVINCDCECDKCDEDLHTAQKIRLLIEAAKHSTYSTANLTDAVNKYKKAKEFCDADCGCGC